MRSEYTSEEIRRLRDRLVGHAPGDLQIAKADLAERLLGELNPEETYTNRYLYSRLSGQVDPLPALPISGRDARRDLQMFVEDLSDAAGLAAEEAGEPVFTLEDLSRRLNVSTKTITRWRRDGGLVGRRFLIDGRKRVGFLMSSVERFVRHNRGRVKRAAQFTQMTDEQRDQIVALARELIAGGEAPARIVGLVAEQIGRSVETVRYVLRQHDEARPEEAILPADGGPLSDEARHEIYRRYRRGQSVEAIGRHFDRSRTSVYRVLAETRLERIRELPLDYIPNEQFERVSPAEEREILAPMPADEGPPRKARRPANLPTYLASLYEVPLLSREQEAHLFRKMNYLKYKASRLLGELDAEHPAAALMDRVERLYEQSVAVKNELIRANLRLVVSIAKRRVGPTEEFFDLVSDGNMSLIRAVEKFDFARGFKFSTYATWAIVKNYARTIPGEHRTPGDVEPAVQKDRTKQRLESVGKQGVAIAAPLQFLAAAQPDVFVEFQVPGDGRQGLLLDQLRADARQLALLGSGIPPEAFLGYAQLQHGVAQKFQPLVIVVSVLLIGERGVRKRVLQELDLGKPMVDTIL